MTTCKDINNLLPAYLEDLLIPEEKKCVEEHLHTCSHCRQDVADLQKVAGLLRNLEEVEPPPFFEQRIMAAIREENRKKHGILRKFFFPLHIKIPIQALTTVLIAVFAFYVYQESNPEIKQMVPLPMPVIESTRNQIKPEIPKTPTVPSATTRDREVPPVSPQAEKRQQFAPPPIAGEGNQEGIAAYQASLKEERREEIASKDAKVVAKYQNSVVKGEADTTPAMPSSGQSRISKIVGVGSAARQNKDMMSASSPLQATEAAPVTRSALNLTIQVLKMDQGRQDIEACLGRFNARIMERKHRGETAFLKAEIDARHIADFVQQMEEIGRVRTSNKHLDNPAGNVVVGIKIDRLP
jgi:hypothetical protein